MAYRVYETGEKYDCSRGLKASAELFSSLQCQIRACGGNKKNLDNICRSCDNYINNAISRDAEEEIKFSRHQFEIKHLEI